MQVPVERHFADPQRLHRSAASWHMPMYYAVQDTAYWIRAPLHGISLQALHISAGEKDLTIRCEAGGEWKQEAGQHRAQEPHFEAFARTIGLPEGVDTAAIEAHYDDGVLMVRLPKTGATGPTWFPEEPDDLDLPGDEDTAGWTKVPGEPLIWDWDEPAGEPTTPGYEPEITPDDGEAPHREDGEQGPPPVAHAW